MIRGLHLRHSCPGDYCRVCWWEGRKVSADAPRPRIKIVARIGLCSCVWCLKSVSENARVRAAELDADNASPAPSPFVAGTGQAALDRVVYPTPHN
jgi:hypothetical protein